MIVREHATIASGTSWTTLVDDSCESAVTHAAFDSPVTFP